jgi:hypothetical protein
MENTDLKDRLEVELLAKNEEISKSLWPPPLLFTIVFTNITERCQTKTSTPTARA